MKAPIWSMPTSHCIPWLHHYRFNVREYRRPCIIGMHRGNPPAGSLKYNLELVIRVLHRIDHSHHLQPSTVSDLIWAKWKLLWVNLPSHRAGNTSCSGSRSLGEEVQGWALLVQHRERPRPRCSHKCTAVSNRQSQALYPVWLNHVGASTS